MKIHKKYLKWTNNPFNYASAPQTFLGIFWRKYVAANVVLEKGQTFTTDEYKITIMPLN